MSENEKNEPIFLDSDSLKVDIGLGTKDLSNTTILVESIVGELRIDLEGKGVATANYQTTICPKNGAKTQDLTDRLSKNEILEIQHTLKEFSEGGFTDVEKQELGQMVARAVNTTKEQDSAREAGPAPRDRTGAGRG